MSKKIKMLVFNQMAVYLFLVLFLFILIFMELNVLNIIYLVLLFFYLGSFIK